MSEAIAVAGPGMASAGVLPGRKRKVFYLSLAHLFNDWYMNFLQTLLPFLVAAGMGLGRGAFLVAAFMFTSSVLQPLLGYWVDRHHQRWLVYVGTLWMAVLLSLVGLVHHYGLALGLAVLAGLGTAAFHPQASAMISRLSGGRKGLFQAFFITLGNIGWALTPVMVVPVIQKYGLRATPIFVIPGLLVALLLKYNTVEPAAKSQSNAVPLREIARRHGVALSKIVIVVACRSLTYFGLVAFLPLYLQAQHVSMLRSSHLLFVMLFFGALGGLAGGYISDRYGRKRVIVVSLLLAGPLFYAFLTQAGNGWGVWLLALAGAALLASFSVTVVTAQEIISTNAALASGLMLGFGVGVGGLGVGVIGVLAEHFGLAPAIQTLIWLPLAAGLLALAIETKSVRTQSPQ